MALVDLEPYRARRPHRADAARNFDAILKAARAVFTERGFDAPLDDVAEMAGVGIATVYRNFSTRQVLVENVYIVETQAVVAEMGAVAEAAAGSLELPPREGLTRWLRSCVDFSTQRDVATAIDPDSEVHKVCGAALTEAGAPLLRRARDSGDLRTDIDDDAIGSLILGAAATTFSSEQQREQMLEVLLDGLRAGNGTGDRPSTEGAPDKEFEMPSLVSE
jgi:AcrR family transcriptional regulator